MGNDGGYKLYVWADVAIHLPQIWDLVLKYARARVSRNANEAPYYEDILQVRSERAMYKDLRRYGGGVHVRLLEGPYFTQPLLRLSYGDNLGDFDLDEIIEEAGVRPFLQDETWT